MRKGANARFVISLSDFDTSLVSRVIVSFVQNRMRLDREGTVDGENLILNLKPEDTMNFEAGAYRMQALLVLRDRSILGTNIITKNVKPMFNDAFVAENYGINQETNNVGFLYAGDETISVDMKVEEGAIEVGGTNDYELLINLPSLNGKTILGDMSEEDPSVPKWIKDKQDPSDLAKEIGAPNEEISPLSIQEVWDSIFN